MGALFDPSERSRLDRLAILARRAVRGQTVGERRSRRLGTGGEFADHRSYVLGDEPRYVDWNVYGRLGDLVVKRFEAETSVDVLLLVDRSPSMSGSKSAAARRLAGALGHVALRRRDSATLGWLPPLSPRPLETHRGNEGLEALLASLVDVPLSGRTDHATHLRRVLAPVKRRGPAVLVSDFFDARGAVKGLALLAAHGFEATAVHLLDPADVDLPVGASLRCRDRETGETVDVDATPRFLADLRTAWRRRAEALRSWCLARGIAHHAMDVERPFWDSLAEMVREGVLVTA